MGIPAMRKRLIAHGGEIKINGVAFKMGHGAPNGYTVKVNRQNVVITLHDDAGEAFAYVAAERTRSGGLECGGWFGTASTVSLGVEGQIRYMFGASSATRRKLGITDMSYGQERALAHALVSAVLTPPQAPAAAASST